jgi:ATP diphosphatase
MTVGTRFEEAVAIMERLRGPEGCPWDREQCFASIRQYTLEETYEVLDAIERQDWPNLREELGDLLLQVLFYAEMARGEGYFTLEEVISDLNRKLVRRHPHVFGAEASAQAGNRASELNVDNLAADGVVANWHAIKRLEKTMHAAPEGRLEAVPRSLPALLEAKKLGSAAAKCGFDWTDVRGLIDKLQEEIAEVEAELEQPGGQQALAEEVGDLLFTVANLARKLKLDPEMTLRDANAKFRRRFAAMEATADRELEQLSATQLEELWNRAKQAENEAEMEAEIETGTAMAARTV